MYIYINIYIIHIESSLKEIEKENPIKPVINHFSVFILGLQNMRTIMIILITKVMDRIINTHNMLFIILLIRIAIIIGYIVTH